MQYRNEGLRSDSWSSKLPFFQIFQPSFFTKSGD
jgi:hypothetical protein